MSGEDQKKPETPRMYRSMFADVSGKRPEVGTKFGLLGVRATDVPVSDDGQVSPRTGGMSVQRSLRELRPELIPKRLRESLGLPYARGNPKLHVWRLGTGPFMEARISDNLSLRPDYQGSAHGNLEPATRMSASDYQTALADTRDAWEVDEQ